MGELHWHTEVVEALLAKGMPEEEAKKIVTEALGDVQEPPVEMIREEFVREVADILAG